MRVSRLGWARGLALLVMGLASTQCLGAAKGLPVNPPPPDLGRTAVDPVIPGLLHITFDDGPSLAYTHTIVDIVTAHKCPATFFQLGRQIPGQRDMLEYIRDRGHQVANHSYYHETQTTLSEAVFKQRVHQVKLNIGEADGGRHFFRFPYGAAGEEQMRWLSEIDIGGAAYRPVGWNTDSEDWTFAQKYPNEELSDFIVAHEGDCGGVPNPFARDFVGWTQYTARKQGGGIMLFHDIQRITYDHLDRVLTFFEHPELYWAQLTEEKRAAYLSYYQCDSVDPNIAFRYEALHGGSWPSFAD